MSNTLDIPQPFYVLSYGHRLLSGCVCIGCHHCKQSVVIWHTEEKLYLLQEDSARGLARGLTIPLIIERDGIMKQMEPFIAEHPVTEYWAMLAEHHQCVE